MTLYRTMADLATESLRERLLVGGFSPGARLIPSELEETLSLGRMAIREALKELIGSGLVIQKANKGIYVASPPSIDELDALFDARCALEGKIAAIAASKISKESLAALERLYDEMADPNKSAIEYHLINRKFHLALYHASGWRHAVVCVTHMLDQILSYFGPRASQAELDFTDFNEEHRRILDAIYAKKTDEVRDVIVANINRGRQFMSSLK